MTSPDIPPQAITAVIDDAYKAVREHFHDATDLTGYDEVVLRELIHVALEAAAPHIRADGMLHAIARLDRFAAAHSGSCWAGAYEAAAAALREELKIAEEPERTA